MINRSLEKYKGAAGIFPISIDCKKDTYFKTAELDQANSYINENKKKALFSPICTFKSESKTAANIENITAHFIDIDSHIAQPSNEELEQLKDLILNEAHNGVIPIPSAINNSGRGLHIYYNLKAGTTDIAKWQLTQQALQGKIDNIVAAHNALYGVENLQLDKACSNANRQTRITGTYNAKARKYVKCLYRSNKIYTQEELIKAYGLQYTDSKGNAIDISAMTPEQTLNATKAQLKEFHNLYGEHGAKYSKETLRIARLQDLITLINSRNARSVLSGYREDLLYIAAFILREGKTPAEQLYNDLLELNKLFLKPLKSNEVVKHARYCVCSKQQYFSNKYIIGKLHISEAEQMKNKTIMCPKISKKKRNARYYAHCEYQNIKDQNERKRAAKQRTAAELKAQGYSVKAIAKQINCDRTTVWRWLNK